MPDILIRNVPSGDIIALSEMARAAGMDRQDWLCEKLHALAAAPVIHVRYVLRATSIKPRVAAIVIRRVEADMNYDAGRGMTEEQQTAFETAVNYVKRNAAGDREAALGVLGGSFEHVIETLM